MNAIGNGVLALLRHPDQLDLLRRSPDLMDSAVEELLRFDGPLELSWAHVATTAIELGDTRIPEGAEVRVIIASANRDEELFRKPDVLDLRRDARSHLTFAHAHHWLCAPLVRMQARIALGVLIERMPELRLADPAQIRWQGHPVLRGLERLPVRF